MKTNKDIGFAHRYLARIVIEAKTPLALGSGEKTISCDHIVVKDVNGFPYIPGTSITGVIRQACKKNFADDLFGNQEGNGKGSRIIFTSAHMVGKDGTVIEGFLSPTQSSSFYDNFKNLPIRQHVRLNHQGVSEIGGKFDEEVVYKGTRFCFEMEMLSLKDEKERFEVLLAIIHSSDLRIGGGTSNGFGEVDVVSCLCSDLDLTKPVDLNTYLNKTSSLNDPFPTKYSFKNSKTESVWHTYLLKLKANDFFLFGSGHASDNADITPVTEKIITWLKDNEALFSEECVLIPGTSVKGSIEHRLSYHYNVRKGKYADEIPLDELEKHTGKNNVAVKLLFGFEDQKEHQMGNVIISDIIEAPRTTKHEWKLLNHVSIDRFTGGAIEGALFSEEVIPGYDQEFQLNIKVNKNVFEQDKTNGNDIKKAFELTLDDIVTGMLPLGGGVNRGNGCFEGTYTIL